MGKICSTNSTKLKEIREQTHGRLSVSCVSLSCIKGKVVEGKMQLLQCKHIWSTFLSATPCLLLWAVFSQTSPGSFWCHTDLWIWLCELHWTVTSQLQRTWGCVINDLSSSALCWPLVIFVQWGFCSDAVSQDQAVSDWADSRIMLTLRSLKRANSEQSEFIKMRSFSCFFYIITA